MKVQVSFFALWKDRSWTLEPVLVDDRGSREDNIDFAAEALELLLLNRHGRGLVLLATLYPIGYREVTPTAEPGLKSTF